MKKIINIAVSLVLVLTFVISMTVFSAGADVVGGSFTVTKISNPESGYRIPDGLIETTDRETSYAWCMTDRGDYVYIGTNRSFAGNLVNSAAAQMIAMGMTYEKVWDLVDVLTNGEIPRTQATDGGMILRCSKETGKIDVVYTAKKNVSFRMAITYGDNVYFGSYSADGNETNDIFKIDQNDNVEVVYSAVNGTSMRAACIHDGLLFFGGVDAEEVIEPGDEGCQKLAILFKDENDDSVWHRVADYKDFDKVYSTNPAMYNSVSSPVWDIVSYDGYLYATLPNGRGFVMYRGCPVIDDGAPVNEYGWHWEEVIGYYNGINNIGLCESPEGYTGLNAGLMSVTATPFVFNDELYLMDFDMTFSSEINAVVGILQQLSGADVKPSDYLRSMYSTLQHNQSIWKLDNETGKFNRIDSFDECLNNKCDEYLWRTEVYDGELYITTMDSATIYNYVTKLTNGSFCRMTPEEMQDQIGYIKNFIDKYVKKSDEVPAEDQDQVDQIADTAQEMVDDLSEGKLDSRFAEKFLAEYEDLVDSIQDTFSNIKDKKEIVDAKIEAAVESIKAKFMGLYNSVDWEGLKMYAYISSRVAIDEWGFDMFKTADGEHFEAVTLNGFGDKYNYGGRTLLTTDKGLYVGTANPFYGAQLYLLENSKIKVKGILGDADEDGKVTIIDSTVIQMHLANVKKLSELGEKLADVDGDGSITIMDATYIQIYLAGTSMIPDIGKEVWVEVDKETEDPTEAETRSYEESATE